MCKGFDVLFLYLVQMHNNIGKEVRNTDIGSNIGKEGPKFVQSGEDDI